MKALSQLYVYCSYARKPRKLEKLKLEMVLLYVKNYWNLKIKLIIQLNVIGGSECKNQATFIAKKLAHVNRLVIRV
jgi:hypothetical protein